MSGNGRKSLKRRMHEDQEEHSGRSRATKEAKTEVISVGLSEASNLILQTLTSDDWTYYDPSVHQKNEENTSRVSEPEEYEDGSVSRGTMWRGDPGKQSESPSSQICISCKRESNGKKFNCETQTFHFFPTPSARELNVNEPARPSEGPKQAADSSLNLKTVKVEIDADQECFNYPVMCYIRDCESRADEIDSTVSFYNIPSDKQRLLWSEALDTIVPESDGYTQQHVCSQHFITPSELPRAKAKTRKKKTCDMLLAEEAEKIKQGLSAGRPKRTPKPNKNYDWAELVPFIKSEPLEEDELELIEAPKTPGFVGRRRKQMFTTVKKEDKENERPSVDNEMGTSVFQNEEDEYGENVSLPSHPRAPPPKPKGRPHRIRDICTQTDAFCNSSLRQPLREVKVQCNLTAEPLISCSSCSTVNWMRLEELLIDCVSKIEGELCDPLVMECLRQELTGTLQPSYATNVLKLLSGLERDALESAKDIVLVSSQEEEVEIESVIHPEVEAPMTGVREITPKIWQKKPKWARETEDEEEILEDDPDGLGLQEATEMDDEEFHPGFPEPEEEEEELDQELDDEDWNVNKRDGDSGVSGSRKKQKKVHQKNKKEQMLVAEEAGDVIGCSKKGDREDSVGPKTLPKQQTPYGQQLPKKGKTQNMQLVRSKRMQQRSCLSKLKGNLLKIKRSAQTPQQEHTCWECKEVFNTKCEADIHLQQVHLGVAPWQSEYQCDVCKETFNQKISLNVHCMFKHGAPRRYQCDKCDYEGPRLYHLKRHMKVHTDERQYVCSVCSKGLKTAQAYRNHMVLHTNEGRYVCNVCKKAYNQKSLFEDHQRSHKKERNYACKYCDATFKTYKHVACHIRAVHLKDKRFICDLCGAQHMTGANLKTHMRKHKDISTLPYAFHCNGCDAAFRGFDGLSTHMRVIHAVNLVQEKDQASSGKIFVSPHPTRRPMKLEYGFIPNSEETDDPKMVEKYEETIYVEGENFTVYKVKPEDMEYEVLEADEK